MYTLLAEEDGRKEDASKVCTQASVEDKYMNLGSNDRSRCLVQCGSISYLIVYKWEVNNFSIFWLLSIFCCLYSG